MCCAYVSHAWLFFFTIKSWRFLRWRAYLQELSELCVAEVLVPLVAKVQPDELAVPVEGNVVMDCGLAEDVTHILCESGDVSERWQETLGGEVETVKKHAWFNGSIHPSHGLIPSAAVLFNAGKRKVHLEGEIEWGCLTDSPSFLHFDFFSVRLCLFFSLSAPFLETCCTDGSKQQLLYATLHLLVNDIQDLEIVRWSWLWCQVQAALLLSSTYIDLIVYRICARRTLVKNTHQLRSSFYFLSYQENRLNFKNNGTSFLKEGCARLTTSYLVVYSSRKEVSAIRSYSLNGNYNLTHELLCTDVLQVLPNKKVCSLTWKIRSRILERDTDVVVYPHQTQERLFLRSTNDHYKTFCLRCCHNMHALE